MTTLVIKLLILRCFLIVVILKRQGRVSYIFITEDVSLSQDDQNEDDITSPFSASELISDCIELIWQ